MKKKYEVAVTMEWDEDGPSAVEVATPGGQAFDSVKSMITLCEGLNFLIRVAHKAGDRKDHESIKICIDYLKKGFIDETFKIEKLISDEEIRPAQPEA